MSASLQRLQPNPSYWRGRRVLLTGHTGFKGSWLAFWLIQLGAEVTGVALAPETDPNLFTQLGLQDRLDHRHGDICDSAGLAELVSAVRPEVVFHLAAQPLVRRSYQEPAATWRTNVMGTIYLLEALRRLDETCTAVLVTTDKVYRNNEWVYGYRENDPLGGHDPYSSSKAAAEIAISSWRSSFYGAMPHQTPFLRLATARAGNVIGGGDWAPDRIIPDAMRALSRGQDIGVRNSLATRPWQHVLEPLSGYLCLAESLSASIERACAYNFGPHLEANRSVGALVQEILMHWPGSWKDYTDANAPHEATLLNLLTDRAHHDLGWSSRWNFATTVERTVKWYHRVLREEYSPYECCQSDLATYISS